MGLPVVIDTALSIVTVIILLSVVASAVFELLGRYTRYRSKLLRRAIDQALSDPGLPANYAELLYTHPQIRALHRTTLDKPSYIPPKVFGDVLVDTVVSEYEMNRLKFDRKTHSYVLPKKIRKADTLKKLNLAIKEMEFSEFGTMMKSFRDSAQDIESVKANIRQWYAGYMERVGGWYKRRTHRSLLYIGLVMAIVLNIDLIRITSQIYQEEDLRTELVALGLSMEEPADPGQQTDEELQELIKTNYRTISSLGLPMGWDAETAFKKRVENGGYLPFGFWDYVWMIVGWLLSAVAISRGAPFWFNALSTIINLRSTGTTKTTDRS